MKLLLQRSFLFAFQFTIFQAGITTRSLTLIQGSKEKEKKYAVQLYLIVLAQIEPERCA